MNTLNASDFYKAVAGKTGASITSTKETFNAGLEVLKEIFKNGDSLSIIGFGTFAVKNKAGGTKLNPFTKKKIKVAASKVPTFKMSATLRSMLKK